VTPSLCPGWTVKDVVAHLISYEELGTIGLLRRFAKGRIVRANEVGVDEFASLTPQQLIAIPADRLGRVLGLVPGNPRLGAGRRIRGLRLRATDIDWTHGRGPEVTGTGEALLMAMAGRPAAVPDLGGPGLTTLAQRLAR
jgi:hypothetical protein